MIRTAIIGTGNMGRQYADMIYNSTAGRLTLTAMVCRSDEAFSWGKAHSRQPCTEQRLLHQRGSATPSCSRQ